MILERRARCRVFTCTSSDFTSLEKREEGGKERRGHARMFVRGWIGPPLRNNVPKRPRGHQPAKELALVRKKPLASADAQRDSTISLVGNAARWATFREKLDEAIRTTGSRPILLLGPCGVGKTSGARMCARACGRPVVELCAPDATTSQRAWADLYDASTRAGIDGNAPVTLLDDIDAIPAECAPGVVRYVQSVPRQSGAIVMTSATRLPKHISKLRGWCTVVYLEPLTVDDLVTVARRWEREHAGGDVKAVGTVALRAAAAQARGDARQIIHRLRTGFAATGKDFVRDTGDPFGAARHLLYGARTDAEAKLSLFRDAHADALVQALLFDNYVQAAGTGRVIDIDGVSARADNLSAADTVRAGEVRGLLAEGVLVLASAAHGPRKEAAPRQELSWHKPEKRVALRRTDAAQTVHDALQREW